MARILGAPVIDPPGKQPFNKSVTAVLRLSLAVTILTR